MTSLHGLYGLTGVLSQIFFLLKIVMGRIELCFSCFKIAIMGYYYTFFQVIYIFFVSLFQIWDLASGTLKLSLTGHISAVRGVVVSPRQPYLFSCGEDKKVMCWDLEYNKVKLT